MELREAVSLFMNEEFVDAFNPLENFYGKIGPFTEITNSGSSAQRRILETTTDTVVPESHVVRSVTGLTYIVADRNVDFWDGAAIRYKYSIIPVNFMGIVGTLGEILSERGGDEEVYAYPLFVRREADDKESSEYLSGFEIYFSKVKQFRRGQVLKLNNQYFRFKTDSWIDAAGYTVTQSVKIESPIVSYIVSTAGTYNTLTDSSDNSISKNVDAFTEPMLQNYEFVSPAFIKILPGDQAISILHKDISLKVGDRIGDYLILSVRKYFTWNTYHCRYST